MVGNLAYKMWHESLGIIYSRHVNGADGVPYLPLSCGDVESYHHIGPGTSHPGNVE
jgi:hypothetical protein